MKIYHKFLLYQNKLLKPYVRILLGVGRSTHLSGISVVDCRSGLRTWFSIVPGRGTADTDLV